MTGFVPIPIKDGLNNTQQAKVGTDGSGYISPSTVPVDQNGLEINGSQADVAWSGSGSGGVIAILKAIWTKLGSLVLAAGTNVIGKIGVDQTTYGTTNRVAADLYGINNNQSVMVGHGTATGALRVELPTDGTGVVIAGAGEAHIGAVGGKIADIVASFSRQANTTAYAAGQVVNDASTNPLDFVNAVRVSGGSGIVLSSRLTIQQVAGLAGVQFRLHLYKSTPGSVTDAAGFNGLWSTRDIWLGWIDFLTNISIGGGADCTVFEGVASSAMALPLIAAASDIYGVLTVLSAWTPTSGAGVNVHLRIDQN